MLEKIKNTRTYRRKYAQMRGSAAGRLLTERKEIKRKRERKELDLYAFAYGLEAICGLGAISKLNSAHLFP